MELEPKHLLPYFPYSLKVKFKNFDSIYDLLSIGDENGIMIISENKLDLDTVGIDGIEPILKPLSIFKEEQIEEIKAFLNHKWCQVYDDYFDALFEHDWLMHTRILMCPYEILQWFFKNHYDVFGLIEKGLAISYNDLNK
jgi:hypothetical protein